MSLAQTFDLESLWVETQELGRRDDAVAKLNLIGMTVEPVYEQTPQETRQS